MRWIEQLVCIVQVKWVVLQYFTQRRVWRCKKNFLVRLFLLQRLWKFVIGLLAGKST